MRALMHLRHITRGASALLTELRWCPHLFPSGTGLTKGRVARTFIKIKSILILTLLATLVKLCFTVRPSHPICSTAPVRSFIC